MTITDLYLCRSPLQLLNCIEAREALGKLDRTNVLIAAHCVPLDKVMMAKLLELYPHWDEVHFFPLYPLGNQVAAMRRVLSRRPVVDRLFVGDSTQFLNLLINRVIRPRSCIMVDDGASTMSRAPLIANRSLHLFRKNLAPQSRFVGKLKSWLGLAPTYLYSAKFFTLYDLQKFGLGDRCSMNTLAHCRSRLAQKPVGEEVWFIGSNFRGDLLAEPADYDKVIDRLARFEDLSRIVYIPHRKEPDDYLARLAKMYGFTVRRFESIIELEVLNIASLPARIMFGSSAVNTLSELIARPATVYQVPCEMIAPHRWVLVKELYETCREKGYAMIDLGLVGSMESKNQR